MNNKQTVIDMAMELDSTIGQYIADAIIDHVSYSFSASRRIGK